MPTSAEIEEMDVAAAEARAEALGLVAPSGDSGWYVDGVRVTAEAARSIPADQVAYVAIVRGEGGHTVIRLTTTGAEAGAGIDEAAPAPGEHPVAVGEFEGLLVIDGVVVESSRLGELQPSEIERVEVIKGGAAAASWDDPRARHGSFA
ncbi:MAG: hypothetical protein ACLFRX_00780 [Gemmatimonadota bacterium]